MNTENKEEVVYLYLDDIIPNRFQPREIFDDKALKELAVSIKEHGVIHPIIVRSVNGKYEIIAGERRYKASALAGLTKIPAIIRDLDDKESSKVALLENLQRKNLNPIEEARTYQKILELDEMTQEELAKTMGKSQSAVANKIRLLGLPDEIQEALLKEKISERHARTLLNIPDTKKQKEMLKKVIANKMTVRALEEEIKSLYPKEEQEQTSQEEESTENSDKTITASTRDFVNNNTLLPTVDLPEETSNYGKVTIAPPEGEEMPEITPKFINYGEIDDDEDDDDEGNETFDLNPPSTSIDVKQIKENSKDINNPENNSTADLDNLLNIQTPQTNRENTTNNFITPAEEIVKTSENQMPPEKVEDYFKIPDLINVELPSEIQPKDTTSVSLNSYINQEPIVTNENEEKQMYTIEEATNKIRDLVKELKDHGIEISTDEMNFEKSYQVIIKIEKTEKAE